MEISLGGGLAAAQRTPDTMRVERMHMRECERVPPRWFQNLPVSSVNFTPERALCLTTSRILMSKGRERAQDVCNYKFSEEHFPQDRQLWLLAALNSVIVTQALGSNVVLFPPSIVVPAWSTVNMGPKYIIVRNHRCCSITYSLPPISYSKRRPWVELRRHILRSTVWCSVYHQRV